MHIEHAKKPHKGALSLRLSSYNREPWPCLCPPGRSHVFCWPSDIRYLHFPPSELLTFLEGPLVLYLSVRGHADDAFLVQPGATHDTVAKEISSPLVAKTACYLFGICEVLAVQGDAGAPADGATHRADVR